MAVPKRLGKLEPESGRSSLLKHTPRRVDSFILKAWFQKLAFDFQELLEQARAILAQGDTLSSTPRCPSAAWNRTDFSNP